MNVETWEDSTVTLMGSSVGEHLGVGPGGQSFRVRWAGATDTGLRRAHNEDSLIMKPPLFAIADGMGGHAHGDLASRAVVEALADLSSLERVEPSDVIEALREATTYISENTDEGDNGTGTTVTGCAFAAHEQEPYFAVFNVGDSRTYALLGERLTRITVDHSVVQELINAGLLAEEEAESHPEANVVTRAVGFGAEPVPDYFLVPIMPNLRLLSCSDGLTKELHDDQIEQIMNENSDPAKAVDALVNAALDSGGRDNVTAIILEVVQAPSIDDIDRTVPRATV
ncbi:MAG: PP2C family protein-serine/threonine phosphatase [Agrococcus casei]|uniref:Protein serine/threonine phosphatase PrpC, regulation of stationary phase n=2 Tax=Agrococcus TaxID=46352 RepID=A0A1R4GIK2_9MICO|nr:Protein serine/threonine phosphatase PrpC, regulation of stationary phase [Agrococcus casei LMG 22410]